MKCAKNSHCTSLLAVFRAPLADPFMVEFDMINSPGKAAISSLINEIQGLLKSFTSTLQFFSVSEEK